MLSLTHTIASLPFGIFLDHPITIFSAAFFFHFLLDTFPHWNLYPEKWGKYFIPLAFVDVTSGLLVAWFITGETFFSWPILLAIFAGNLPDILHTGWEFGKKWTPALVKKPWISWFFHTHDKLQVETVSVFPGLVAQFITVSVALALSVNLG